MSETKPQKEKSDAPKPAADGAASSSPKSAAETSISHFSSVSSPAYKAGWESIFGGSKDRQKRTAKPANDIQFPGHLSIDDADIDEALRSALYKAFQKRARKQGVSLAKIKKQVEFSYSLRCDIEEK